MNELTILYVALAVWGLAYGINYFVADPEASKLLSLIAAVSAIVTAVFALIVAF